MVVQNNQAKIIETTALGACIVPLLKALKWHGAKRHLKEAMPHISQVYTPAMICDVLAHLNYQHKEIEADLKLIDSRLLPCLFILENGSPMVVLRKQGDRVVVFSGERHAITQVDISDDRVSHKGVLYIFHQVKEDSEEKALHESWLRITFNNNRSLFWSALFLSFIVNLLMLATPLYVMSVYDRVVTTGSYQMLGEFVTGVVIALIGIITLYRIRAKIIAIFGARLDRAIGVSIFQRLLYLSPAYTETATVGAQVSRLKDFDRLRQFLAGPLLTTFFDVPYLVIALIIIGLIAKLLVIVPVIMVVAFIILGVSLHFKVKRATRIASFNSSRQQEFILEAITNMRALKYLAAEEKWEKRYRDMSADSNVASLKLIVLGSINTAISDAIMVTSGMAVLVFGALAIINQELTVGAMIATMILIWRVLAPLKTIFNTLPRLQQMASSLGQIDKLMHIEPEVEPLERLSRSSHKFKGEITFVRVSFRYRSSMDPALMGVTFEVKPGEVVGIVGKNASGKSTILKVLLGLYQPQAGSVLIDNQDIRQLNPIELRNSISYVPQKPELFYGTIEANLLLGKPEATMNEMILAAKAAGIYNDIMALPNQFKESLRDFNSIQLSVSFQQGLCLARAYLKKSKILLLDEPAGVLDDNLDQFLMRAIKLCHKRITLMMVSHRPSHLKLCDKILLIDQGQVILFGPPDEVLPKIPKDYL